MPVYATTPSNPVDIGGGVVLDLHKLELALNAPLRAALSELGEDEVANIVSDLSVPVDYSTDPPTRSQPGQPPRYDSGALSASVNFEVNDGEIGDAFPALRVSAGGPEAPYAAGLDQGGEVNTFTGGVIQPRPFMSEYALPRLAARAAEVVAKHLKEALGE